MQKSDNQTARAQGILKRKGFEAMARASVSDGMWCSTCACYNQTSSKRSTAESPHTKETRSQIYEEQQINTPCRFHDAVKHSKQL